MTEELNVAGWSELLNGLPNRRALVVGDAILDAYVYGEATRISAEAPVPIVDVVDEEYRLGGAANVAANLTSLGATCHLIGATGEDAAADELRKRLARANIRTDGLVTDPTRRTSHKTRVVARNQQVVRLDRESRTPISRDARANVMERIREIAPSMDAVIIEDYDKGLLDKEMIAETRDLARRRDVPVIVDPKVENFWHYEGVTCVTPNVHETGAALGERIRSAADLRRAAETLLERLALDFLLITRGPNGMSLFEPSGERATARRIPAIAREVYDVTGAGDTVVAVFALGLAAGATPLIAARLANYAAGQVVSHMGCVTVSPDELRSVVLERAEADATRIETES